MNKLYGFKGLEKKYGIKVRVDGFRIECYKNAPQKTITLYRIYSADSCPWENGLTRAGVKKECEEWSEALLKIKKIVDKYNKEKGVR